MSERENLKQSLVLKKNVSRDEMNLAEFPLTVLSTRSDPNIKTLEFQDTVYDKNRMPTKRKWVITGADKFGLPTASDDEVLLGLMKLTVDDGFKERKVFFTRYELLLALRWTTEGRSYTRLQNALDRLSGVRIKATNAFYDNDSKTYSTKNFGIIDGYEINDGRGAGVKPSFFTWSEEIFKSFQVGFIKKIDLDFFLDLKSAVSKRLYRYLDKNFYYKSVIEANLFTLAHEKIGVSRTYKYASSIRQQLDPAIEELIECGYLSKCEYEGKGKNTKIILYQAQKVRGVIDHDTKKKKLLEDTKLAENDDIEIAKGSDVVSKLVERGLKLKQAENLLAEKSEEELKRIEQIIDYYDKLVDTKSRLVSKSPVGFLFKAIQNSETFVLPAAPKTQKKIIELKQKKIQEGMQKRQALEKQYQNYRRVELDKARDQLDEHTLKQIQLSVERSLDRVKKMISDSHFKEAVAHGIDEKLAETIDFPTFEEWIGEKGAI